MEREEEIAGLVEELSALMIEEAADGVKNPKKEIERLVSEKTFGPGVSDKRVNVGWGGMFARSECPVCGERIEKAGSEYVCGACGLRIPSELFEKAREQHMRESVRREKEQEIRERMAGMGLTRDEISGIYERSLERSESADGSKKEGL
jgi:hypothetical protein